MRCVKETETAVGHAVDVAVAVFVVRVVPVVGVAEPAVRTMGSPLLTVTQILPLPSAVTAAPFP